MELCFFWCCLAATKINKKGVKIVSLTAKYKHVLLYKSKMAVPSGVFSKALDL